MDFVSTEKPRWYQFRYRLSRFLVIVAKKIYPKNPDVIAFHLQLFYDSLIYGKAVVRISPLEEFNKNDNT